MNGVNTSKVNPFKMTNIPKRSGGYKNDLEEFLAGHRKNSYGVEGMDVTGRNGDYKKIIPVSTEMKEHVLDDVKKGYYKYNGMSGDNEAEWDAYYRKNNEYYKTLKREDRLSACWTLGQLHTEIANRVSSAIKAQVPGWQPGNPIPEGLLDNIFADESITSLVYGKSDTSQVGNPFHKNNSISRIENAVSESLKNNPPKIIQAEEKKIEVSESVRVEKMKRLEKQLREGTFKASDELDMKV